MPKGEIKYLLFILFARQHPQESGEQACTAATTAEAEPRVRSRAAFDDKSSPRSYSLRLGKTALLRLGATLTKSEVESGRVLYPSPPAAATPQC